MRETRDSGFEVVTLEEEASGIFAVCGGLTGKDGANGKIDLVTGDRFWMSEDVGGEVDDSTVNDEIRSEGSNVLPIKAGKPTSGYKLESIESDIGGGFFFTVG